MERNRSGESSSAGVCFLWLCRMLRKTGLGDLAFWHVVSWHESHLQWLLVKKFDLTLKWNHWDLFKLEEGWKEVHQGIACCPCCWIVLFLFLASLLLLLFQPPQWGRYFYKQQSIKLHRCDSFLETRVLPTRILLGRGRNSMSLM